MPASKLSRRSIVRIVTDLVAGEIASSRGLTSQDLGTSSWTEATRMDADGLDLDSLERLDVGAALNEYFHLHEYGAEDMLLGLRSIGGYADLVAQSLKATGTFLTFRTSGSTGTPTRCTHRIADLMVEVDAWAAMLDPAAIMGLVPAHHIYGTIFTALLPDRLGIDVTEARDAPAVALSAARAGTVVVGTPTMWAYAARSLLAFPAGLTGVTSTAPMPAQLAHRLTGQRLQSLVEIYGSSETGGVAYRDDPSAPFALLDHWARSDAGLIRTGAAGAITCPMADEAEWLDDRRFALRGRRDGAVQVGGHNVFPERVRLRLLDHEGVEDASVRVDAATGRLKAFIVPADAADASLADDLDAWCGAGLTSAERPRRFAIGGALPRNAMGKLSDW